MYRRCKACCTPHSPVLQFSSTVTCSKVQIPPSRDLGDGDRVRKYSFQVSTSIGGEIVFLTWHTAMLLGEEVAGPFCKRWQQLTPHYSRHVAISTSPASPPSTWWPFHLHSFLYPALLLRPPSFTSTDLQAQAMPKISQRRLVMKWELA